ncbi:hypothetical protein VB738_10920 [Cyanobium gracile UHCC 0139]|uniref:Uncharacterized protein n=1 Tax=Cyanobium gracile UHCC 0139 TaxID=3110308 RepID=A0ABU5RVI8_9CYAN|nr:hypothetical protein [Cyanobium gracile]MEA5391767.1 hypothetical protein [Cyanobium gracile UHCC 0139]
MSFLSEAMQLLKDAGTAAGLSEGAIKCHAGCYRENLSRCSDAMLQYERVWLQQQLRALRDCEGHPVLMARVGGEDRLRGLVSQSVLFQLLLQNEFARRGLTPEEPRGPVVAAEEAWEITSVQVKREWGILPT